ncbi:MAG: hypothetical protein GXP62_02785 [Oligoflexia bacterium]|nr:hypothetical protein [Oligoflexia bacterium]
MSPPDTAWKTLPHGPIEPLAENLWRVEGELPKMRLRRCMVIVRLRCGELLLHSAVALDEAGMEALEALGRPTSLVVPNGWHRLDAARYKARYPDLQVICPAAARERVEQVVAVDATYEDRLQPYPDDDTVRLELLAPGGMEGAMLVRSQDGVSAVFADALFNLPHQPGIFWFVYGRLLGATGGPRITLIGRIMMAFTRTGRPTRAWMKRIADQEPLVRLVPCHGQVVSATAAAVLHGVAAG